MFSTLHKILVFAALASLMSACTLDEGTDSYTIQFDEPDDPPVTPDMIPVELSNTANRTTIHKPEPDDPPAHPDMLPPLTNPTPPEEESPQPELGTPPVDDSNVAYIPALVDDEIEKSGTTNKSYWQTFLVQRYPTNGLDTIWYTIPLGDTIGLTPSACAPDTWCCTGVATDPQAICYYNFSSGQDDIIQFSLRGSHSRDCTILHSENDYADKFYMASDYGNNCVSSAACFKLREIGNTGPPVDMWDAFKIACF